MSVLDMILNCIWWWGSSLGALGNVEYLFIAITPWFTLTWIGSTCYTYSIIYYTWNHSTVYKQMIKIR